jgi:hypothetical protein
MPGLTASPTAESTPTGTPTPTPTPTSTESKIAGTIVDLSDPELGIMFDDIPELSGDEADVHNWLATYRLEYWRTLVENQPSPAFVVFTSPELQADMASLAAENAADGWRVEGTFHVTIGDVVVDGDSATATTCDDYTHVSISDDEGPVPLEEEGAEAPVLLKATLARNPRAEGAWTVLLTDRIGSC